MVFSILSSNYDNYLTPKTRPNYPTTQSINFSTQNNTYNNIQVNSQSLRENTKGDIDAIVVKNNLIRSEVDKYINKRPLIIHCCHHKTGTVVIEKILRAVCGRFGLKYQYCNQSQLEQNTDVWLEHHSKIDFSLIDRPIIGTHMIRNPYALIVSAYEYHKMTIEPWANRKIKKLNGVTYKEILNKLSMEEGLMFEIKNELYLESSRNTIMDIYNWDYMRPNFLELKFEDLMTNYDGTLANMFKHYGFTREMIEEAISIAQPYNLRNKNEAELNMNKHVTNKSLDLEKWRGYYNENVIKKFWKVYPEDLFTKIGYIDYLPLIEKNNFQFLDETNSDNGEILSKNELEKLISITGNDSMKESVKVIEEKVIGEKEKLWRIYNGGNPFMFD